MRKSMKTALGLCATTMVLATTLEMPLASGAAGPPAVSQRALTDLQIATMVPAAQAALLDPLRATAGALSEAGRGMAADVFTSVEIDANHGVVNLYLTEPTRADGILETAKSANPSIDTSLVRPHRSTYTRAALARAQDAYLAQPHPYAVYAVSAAPDGSGLQIAVDTPATAGTADGIDVAVSPLVRASTNMFSPVATVSSASTVARIFTKGFPRQAKSDAWNNIKWHDHPPFIGGDVITNGSGHCTTGLPAVRQSDGRPVMVTAAHCFKLGERVFTGAGKTWSWSNHRIGNYVGTVRSRSQVWDAELLVGADNNADESDVNRWIPLTSVRYSFRGDMVCHSGAKSAYRGHSSPCGIKVTNPDTRWLIHGYVARGVEGVDVHGWGSVVGDSGATVWAATGNPNARQARGIVSDGGKDGTADQRRVLWTEAVDIFRAFGLKLNPVR